MGKQAPPSARKAREEGLTGMDNVDSGWKGLCSAFNGIMGRQLPKPDMPVLCETQVEKTLRDQKAEYKEKKLLAMKEKSLQNQGCVLPQLSDKALELQLRRVATKGVVRLFNTIKEFQNRDEDEVMPRHQRRNMPIKKRASEMHLQRKLLERCGVTRT